MPKIESLYAPVELTFTTGGATNPGTVIRLDTNIDDTIVLWTLDGSLPVEGNFGTFFGEPPIDIEIKTTTRVRARAYDRTKPNNTTKTLEQTYTVTRTETEMESFNTTERFHRKLVSSVVDLNFYKKEGWVVPTSENPLYYVFVNNEKFSVAVNFIHNGVYYSVDSFPELAIGESFEFPVLPSSGDNTIEIETAKVV